MPIVQRIKLWVAIVSLILLPTLTQAAVVTVTNATAQKQGLRITHADGKSETAVLQPFQTQALTVGTKSILSTYLNDKLERFALEPYHGYAYVSVTNKIAFQGIGFDGTMPEAKDVTDSPIPGVRPYELQVKIVADKANPALAETWEKEYRDRITAASAILKAECNVTLKVVAVETWTAPTEAEDVQELLFDFQQKVAAKPATLVIGYLNTPVVVVKKETSDWPSPYCNQGPLQSHILLRDGFPKSENGRLEYLVHDLAHYFGAVHAPDPISTARANLDNGLAASAKFRIGFDPMNLLVMNIWADQIRTGNVRQWSDIDATNRERLTVIYKTLRRGMPDDQLVGSHILTLGNLDGSIKPGTKLPQIGKPRMAQISPQALAIRKVVQAITIRADELHLIPANSPNKFVGDALTSEYIRVAAETAMNIDNENRVTAFLVGLGIALDNSSLLRDNPLTGKLSLAAETDAERRLRLSVLGLPTVAGRRDLCQHFAVSTALTEVVGSTITRTAGFAKEAKDMASESGFSFTDIAADLAGIRFAQAVKDQPGLLPRIAKQFDVNQYIPKIDNLAEGLNRDDFEKQYGSTRDQRFIQQVDEIDKAIDRLPTYK